MIQTYIFGDIKLSLKILHQLWCESRSNVNDFVRNLNKLTKDHFFKKNYSRMKVHLADKKFSTSSDFNQIMSTDRFLKICVRLSFCMPNEVNDYRNVLSSKILDDSLYSACSILEQFWKTSSKIAVPIGAMALDEAGSGATVTFNKSKHHKYDFRFYTVVGCMYQCYPIVYGIVVDETKLGKVTLLYTVLHINKCTELCTLLIQVTLLLNILIQVLCE